MQAYSTSDGCWREGVAVVALNLSMSRVIAWFATEMLGASRWIEATEFAGMHVLFVTHNHNGSSFSYIRLQFWKERPFDFVWSETAVATTGLAANNSIKKFNEQFYQEIHREFTKEIARQLANSSTLLGSWISQKQMERSYISPSSWFCRLVWL